MASYNLPHFGELDTKALDSYYEVELEVGGSMVSVDLSFEGDTIQPSTLDRVKSFLEKLDRLDTQNKGFIEEDYDDGEGPVVEYFLNHHLEMLEPNDLSTILGSSEKSIDIMTQLKSKLQLVRVGFYPDGEDSFCIFDYSLGVNITNYLLAISLDKDGKLESMSMES